MDVATVDSRTGRQQRIAAMLAAACVGAALSLAGCGSISEKFSQLAADAPVIGLLTGTPERPVARAAYPAVHDMPPARPEALSTAEQIKLEDELVAARNRQQTLVGQTPSPAPASYAPAPAPSPIPAPAASKKPPAPSASPSSSSQSIY